MNNEIFLSSSKALFMMTPGGIAQGTFGLAVTNMNMFLLIVFSIDLNM